jgi:hypothetical protein
MSQPAPTPTRPVAREIVVSVADPLAREALLDVVRELPEPASLAPRSWIAVRVSAPSASLWSRLTKGQTDAHPALAVACTALLAAGYTRIGTDDSVIAYGCADPAGVESPPGQPG